MHASKILWLLNPSIIRSKYIFSKEKKKAKNYTLIWMFLNQFMVDTWIMNTQSLILDTIGDYIILKEIGG